MLELAELIFADLHVMNTKKSKRTLVPREARGCAAAAGLERDHCKRYTFKAKVEGQLCTQCTLYEEGNGMKSVESSSQVDKDCVCKPLG